MYDEWVCSQCETLNKNADKCIVCGMTRNASEDTVKRVDNKKDNTRIKIAKSRLKAAGQRLNFDFADVSRDKKKEKNRNILSAISLIMGIPGIPIIILLGSFGSVFSLGAVITGIIAIRKNGNKALAISGIVLGGIGLAIMGSMQQ